MDDLKNVFDKIEKAESILHDLEKKREEGAAENNTTSALSREHQNTIDSARHAIASIKEKLGKELAVRTLELDKCQEELVLLQTRLKAGEITGDVFQSKSKQLAKKIKSLEKKVVDTQKLIYAKFAEDVAPIIESGKPVSEPGPAPSSTAGEKVKSPGAAEINEEITEIRLKEADKRPEGEGKGKEGEKEPVVLKEHKPSFHLHPLNEPPRKKDATLKTGMLAKNRALWVIVAAIIAGLALISAITMLIPRTGSHVGNTAPDFVMQLSSESISALSSFRGANVMLVFWDRDFWDNQFFHVNGVERKLYTPDTLNQLHESVPQSELAIIAIASGTSNSEIDKLIKDYNVKFPVIVDSFGKLRSQYNITEEPTYIFIDKDGVIRARVEGPLPNLSELEQIVYSISRKSEVKQYKLPITDVMIQSITEKSAVINWTTSTPTTTQVDIDGKNIQTVITPSPTTLHSLTLRDLEPGASYRVRIVYNVNNINVSEHSFSALNDTIVSRRYSFTTSNSDNLYPEISGINTGFVTDSSITVTWKTDEPTTGNVDYSTNKNYNGTATQGSNMSIWHTVKIDGLQPDTLYTLRIRSRDASGKEALQEIEAIKTLSTVEIAPVLGKRAPNFTLSSLDGTKFTLNQFQGRPVLLNFWVEGCPPCELEMPILQKAFTKYNRDELIILAVNVRGEVDNVSHYVGTQKFTFPVLLDTQGEVDAVYRPPYFPTSYFIDSSGIIRNIVQERFQSISEIDDILSKLE